MENQDRPAQEAAGMPLEMEYMTLQDQGHVVQSSCPVRDFPFPRERIYVRTSLGTVGYLTHNDRPGSRAVRGLLGNPNSEIFTSAPLQHLTWEEARA